MPCLILLQIEQVLLGEHRWHVAADERGSGLHKFVVALRNASVIIIRLIPSSMQNGVIDDLKRAIAEDNCSRLEDLLKSERLSRRSDRIDLVIDEVFEELRGRSCLHR